MLVIRNGKGRPEVGFGLARSQNKPRESISKCYPTRNEPLIDPRWLGDSAAIPHVAAFPMAPAVAESLLYYAERQQQRRQIQGRGRAGRPRAAQPRPRPRTGTRARPSAPTRRSREGRAARGPRPSTAPGATWKRDRILGNVSSFGVGGPPCQDPRRMSSKSISKRTAYDPHDPG